MPGFTEIENYEPSDTGWGVVVGRFTPKPPAPVEPPADEAVERSAEEERPISS
jgi:hypothetical protein